MIIEMTQEERWQQYYEELMRFVKTNHRNLLKYEMTERRLYTWMKHNRKQMNAGKLKPERVEDFKKLMRLCEENRHVNQWV